MDKSEWTNEQWEEYLTEGHQLGEDELSKRLDERDAVIDAIMNNPDYVDDYTPPKEIIGLQTEGGMDPKYGGVISYKTMANGDHVDRFGNVISTRESRAKEDIPQWKKFELGRLEIVDNVVIPGPNALQKDHDQYGDNYKLTKRYEVEQRKKSHSSTTIAPDDPNYTPLEKALNWASETHHGQVHVDKWNRVAASMGEDNGYHPMTPGEVESFWKQHNRNARWTMAMEELKDMPESGPEPKPNPATIGVGATTDSMPTKIMPDDPNYTSLEKALNWASETHHGPKHQERWHRVAAALGDADNGYEPFTYAEIEHLWDEFGANRRWTMAIKAYEEMYGIS